MIFRKVFRHRFICVALLSLAIIIFLINGFSKSAHELSLFSKAKEGILSRIVQADTHRAIPSENVPINLEANDRYDDNDNDNSVDGNNNDNINYSLEAIKCAVIEETNATIKTVDTFAEFQFDAEWMKKRAGIWQDDFDARYERQKKDKKRPPLKVFILPHSHNDPGWLKTFHGYFEENTKLIINTMVRKLIQYKEMRFVWTEISFLDLWWRQATAEQRESFKTLVSEGRIEIMTGGWVMTDEANVHIYAMLDQLIEGHQWVKSNLKISPKIGWSIDPFGQGSTVPHLLAKSGFEGAIIQRIHYNWKEHFARYQQGDFFWKTHWTTPHSSQYTLLTHNMPFDIYSTHHSCGPVPFACDDFDFEKRPPNINDANIEANANKLIQQYSKLASLFTHNVAFVLVGGDFTYSKDAEFDNQYSGYKKLIDYVNANSDPKYEGAKIQFGTPHDYFNEIRQRQKDDFPSLVGDFFPYSDIFSSGMPAYWTGYFTTRPHYKFMSRKLEHNLRNAEILFTIVNNRAKQNPKAKELAKEVAKDYEAIVEARRNLGLFQHHDAITGTSKLRVMTDYLGRLQKSANDVYAIQQNALKYLLKTESNDFVISGIDRPEADIRIKVGIEEGATKQIVLFNSLAQDRVELVSVLTTTPHIRVTDSASNELKCQINPVFDSAINFEIASDAFEVNVLVKIPAMSLVSLSLAHDHAKSGKAVDILCRKCNNSQFFKVSEQSGPIEIGNAEIKLMFNESTGFLQSLKRATSDELHKLDINFGGYKSGARTSGSYLFKPDMRTPEHADIFKEQPEAKIYVSRGELSSDVTVIRGPLLSHTIRIFHTQTYLDSAISVKNIIDFGEAKQNRDVEMVMRINSNIENDRNAKKEPEFFTDLNSFQWQPRRTTQKLGVEGNYYPITSSVFIQDESLRLSLLTTHAQGTTSFQKGQLEVMLDRRISYDDGRGMGEGVTDSVRMEHKFWLTLEFFAGSMENKEVDDAKKYHSLSLFANHLANSLNYPVNAFLAETAAKVPDMQLFTSKLPCDTHVVNLRSLSDNPLERMPARSALFILHRFGSDCQLSNEALVKNICEPGSDFGDLQYLRDLKVEKVQRTSLTGLDDGASIESFRGDSLDAMEIRSYKVTMRGS